MLYTLIRKGVRMQHLVDGKLIEVIPDDECHCGGVCYYCTKKRLQLSQTTSISGTGLYSRRKGERARRKSASGKRAP